MKYNITITICNFDDLEGKARQTAIEEHRSFLLDCMTPNDFISGDPEYDTPGQLNAQYEAEYEYYLMEDEPIIESIQANDYLYYPSGKIARATEYPAGMVTVDGKPHPNAGKIIFTDLGQAIEVTAHTARKALDGIAANMRRGFDEIAREATETATTTARTANA